MSRPTRSPTRAHILASINPHSGPRPRLETTRASPVQDVDAPPVVDDEKPTPRDEDDPLAPRSSRFRFKSKTSRRHRRRSRSRSHPSRDEHDDHRSSRHRHHHRRKRRRPEAPAADGATQPDGGAPPATRQGGGDEEEEDPFAPAPLDADAAFRAALFDAMADDEGAAYWEGVYGQPLHVYGAARDAPAAAGPAGELERMTDEEYAAFVRQRMWEKTHAGVLEARERRAREREAAARKADEDARAARDRRRAEERNEDDRRARELGARFAEYAAAWAGWDGSAAGMRWPAPSGRRADAADDEAVRAFFVLGLDLPALGARAFAARLRDERVRWHPDKMQQRLGPAMDEALARDVTRIFQIIDKLWGETREKA